MQITVIIPVFNKRKYLEKTLNSVCTQTFTDFECILIDDGSTDGSGEICDTIAARDERFQVFHILNGGVSHARNVGLEHAKGAYLTFVDGDDLLHPAYLENLYRCLTESGADMVISGYKKVWADVRPEKIVVPRLKGLHSTEAFLPTFALEQRNTGIYGCCTAKLFATELVQGLRFDESLRLGEDFDFYLTLYPRLKTIYFDDKGYYEYLQEAENSTALVQSDRIDYEAQFRICLHYRQTLTEMRAYYGENQAIVEHLLSNYAHFILFYSPANYFKERFKHLVRICKEECLLLQGEDFLQKWLLLWLRHDVCTIPQSTMVLYRLARKLLR